MPYFALKDTKGEDWWTCPPKLARISIKKMKPYFALSTFQVLRASEGEGGIH